MRHWRRSSASALHQRWWWIQGTSRREAATPLPPPRTHLGLLLPLLVGICRTVRKDWEQGLLGGSHP
uniref:Uncharacterized protein n=1 Tax=Arundo donax TaxID=35708 RepID=A0A0A9GPJ1_ARUDO